MSAGRFRFYRLQSSSGSPVADEVVKVWRPGLTSVMPPGPRSGTAYVWWLLHQGRGFANRDYAVAYIDRGGSVIHRSFVFPRYMRFPFMSPGDLQIGDTWTHPEHRGRGYAVLAIRGVLSRFACAGRSFWYVVEVDNLPSIRAVERAGFELVGTGDRLPRFGINALAAYRIGDPERESWKAR